MRTRRRASAGRARRPNSRRGGYPLPQLERRERRRREVRGAPFSRRISACIACGCGGFTVIESSCAKCFGPSCRLATICSTADNDVRMPGTAIRSAGVKSRSGTEAGRFAFSDSDVVDSPLMPITSTFGMPRARACSMKPGAPAPAKSSVPAIIASLTELPPSSSTVDRDVAHTVARRVPLGAAAASPSRAAAGTTRHSLWKSALCAASRTHLKRGEHAGARRRSTRAAARRRRHAPAFPARNGTSGKHASGWGYVAAPASTGRRRAAPRVRRTRLLLHVAVSCGSGINGRRLHRPARPGLSTESEKMLTSRPRENP